MARRVDPCGTDSAARALSRTRARRGLAISAAAGVVAERSGRRGRRPQRAGRHEQRELLRQRDQRPAGRPRPGQARGQRRDDRGRPALGELRWPGPTQLAHNPKLASSVSNWRYLGENVGVGYSVSSLEAAFYASPHHRANMLDRDFTQIGVAVVVVNGKMWVAEEFRRPMHGVTSAPRGSGEVRDVSTKRAVNLGVGSRGSLVALVQRLLHITADGIYGPQTKSAVSSFQRHHHLKVTGRVRRRAGGPQALRVGSVRPGQYRHRVSETPAADARAEPAVAVRPSRAG